MRNKDLTPEEKEVLSWLSERRESGKATIAYSDFVEKVEQVVGTDMEDIDEETFRFNLHAVTVTLEDGERMYPIRDLEQGITRGYSTD
jgi:hypothetical protein